MKKIYIGAFLIVSFVVGHCLFAETSSDSSDASLPSLKFFQIRRALNMESCIAALLEQWHPPGNLMQHSLFTAVDGQVERSEDLEINPVSKDYVFVGVSNVSGATIFGCARIKGLELAYSDLKKKWFVTLPGATEFMTQSPLDKIFFYSSPTIRNLYATAVQEWEAGIKNNQGPLVAEALDKFKTLDSDLKGNRAEWTYQSGSVKFHCKLEGSSMVQLMEVTKGNEKSMTTTNTQVPLGPVSLPAKDVVDWSGADNVATFKPHTESDVIRAVESAAAKRPVFGFAFAKEVDGSVVVTGVAPGTPAERAGLKTGMQIEQINGASVSTIDAFALLDIFKQASEVRLGVKAKDGAQTISLKK